jgi:hypothetical protein
MQKQRGANLGARSASAYARMLRRDKSAYAGMLPPPLGCFGATSRRDKSAYARMLPPPLGCYGATSPPMLRSFGATSRPSPQGRTGVRPLDAGIIFVGWVVRPPSSRPSLGSYGPTSLRIRGEGERCVAARSEDVLRSNPRRAVRDGRKRTRSECVLGLPYAIGSTHYDPMATCKIAAGACARCGHPGRAARTCRSPDPFPAHSLAWRRSMSSAGFLRILK